MATLLPQAFYAEDAVAVAPRLIGMHLRHGDVVMRITEVEAYPPGDSASHCRMGRTARNEPMWGPPGHVYVYLCYGIHMMLNVTTNAMGEGAAVLIRGCEPIAGLDTVLERRGGQASRLRLDGPGKVGAALALDRSFSGQPLYQEGGLTLEQGSGPNSGLLVGSRVGIDFAKPRDIKAKLRFAAADSLHVSRRKELRPLPRRS